VFSTLPEIVYVTVPLFWFGEALPHDFVALIAQVLNEPSRIDFKAAVAGLLPEVTLANITLLKQGALPSKMPFRSTPPSSNCSVGMTPPANPANPGPLTLNPTPGA